MARSFNGTNASLESSAPVTAVPLTMACRFYPTTTPVGALIALGVNGGTHRFQMFTGSVVPVSAFATDGTTSGQSDATGSISAGNWYHAAAVYSTTSNRLAYFNGVAGTANTASITPTGINRLNIGARYNTTLGAFCPAAIAEVAVWNVALTAEEIAAHAAGFSADQIRPGNLVYYQDLIRDIRDIRGGLTITEIGTATTFFDHPRIFL